MNNISLKKILVLFLLLVLVSHSRDIIRLICELDVGEIFSLRPLRESPEQAKFFVAIMTGALLFTTVFCLLNKHRRK